MIGRRYGNVYNAVKLFRTILFTVSALGGQRFSVEFDAQRRYLGQVARARLEGGEVIEWKMDKEIVV